MTYFLSRFQLTRSLRLTGLLACLLLTDAPALRATTVEPPQFVQLVNESDYIVRTKVVSVRSEWNGQPGSGNIFTYVELEVLEVIAGTPPSPLVLELLGGRVGQDELILQGAPRFAVGQEDILFIQGNGRNIYPLMAMMHGRYPVLKDANTGRRYIARSNHVPMEDPTEVSLPLLTGPAAETQRRMKDPSKALSPDDLRSRVQRTIDPHYRRDLRK